MDRITELIKTEIKRQYKSLRRFSEESGIPYSTLSNALSKGIGSTSYDTVVRICNLLNLKQLYDEELIVFNKQFHSVCSMLTQLDARGVHTVETVLMMEYSRCINSPADASVKAFNGLVFENESINALKVSSKNDVGGTQNE